jgi:hypothetical protein
VRSISTTSRAEHPRRSGWAESVFDAGQRRFAASIACGFYNDALRATNADGTFTLAMGPIAVVADPEELAA